MRHALLFPIYLLHCNISNFGRAGPLHAVQEYITSCHQIKSAASRAPKSGSGRGKACSFP